MARLKPCAKAVLAFVTLLSPLALHSQKAIVEVTKIDFNDVEGANREDSIEFAIEFAATGDNPDQSARNKDFIDNIKVSFSCAYRLDEGFAAFESSVDIPTIEVGEDYTVFFYIPYEVSERDRFPDEPFGFLAEIEVNGETQTPSKRSVSANIDSARVLESYRSVISSNASQYDGVMQPIYLTEFYFDGRRRALLPPFIRREVR